MLFVIVMGHLTIHQHGLFVLKMPLAEAMLHFTIVCNMLQDANGIHLP